MAIPNVLCLSGLDPTGGAGLQADIEACAAAGVHALGVATALTVQDTHDVAEVRPVDPALLRRQLERLLDDCEPAAVKIGLIGSVDQIPVLADILARLKRPTVCDPILRAGGGTRLLAADTIERLLAKLLPSVTLLTPNVAEARRLTPEATDLPACARALLERGCDNVLVTGGDEPGDEVVNTLFRRSLAPLSWRWPQLPGPFHGAGCTLAATVSARLALGEDIEIAVATAQERTHAMLERAHPVGHGRSVPGRTA